MLRSWRGGTGHHHCLQPRRCCKPRLTTALQTGKEGVPRASESRWGWAAWKATRSGSQPPRGDGRRCLGPGAGTASEHQENIRVVGGTHKLGQSQLSSREGTFLQWPGWLRFHLCHRHGARCHGNLVQPEPTMRWVAQPAPRRPRELGAGTVDLVNGVARLRFGSRLMDGHSAARVRGTPGPAGTSRGSPNSPRLAQPGWADSRVPLLCAGPLCHSGLHPPWVG